MKMFLSLGGLVALLAGVGVAQVGADEKTKQMARVVLGKYQDAVVSVKASGKLTFEVDGQESSTDFKLELAGTVLSPDGLTAVCAETLRLASGQVGWSPGEGVSAKVNYDEVKLALKGGREVDAEIFSPKENTGLAFLIPRPRDLKVPFISFGQAPLPGALDDVIAVSRLPESLDREADVAVLRVSAVLKKQKALVINAAADSGCAVFDDQGHPLGICVIRYYDAGKTAAVAPRDFAVVLTGDAINAQLKKARNKWKHTEK